MKLQAENGCCWCNFDTNLWNTNPMLYSKNNVGPGYGEHLRCAESEYF